MSEDNLHLTLNFFPHLDIADVEEIDAVLSALRSPPIALRFLGWAQLPSSERGLLALDVDGGAALKDLQARLTQSLRRAGLYLERRRFQPHVTLARPSRSRPMQPQKLSAFLAHATPMDLPQAYVTEIALMQSHLGAGEPVYEKLVSYPLHA